MNAVRNLRGRPPATRGMSLLELLIAMSIIVFLLSLSVAGISGARSSAKGTMCLSHLKEIGNATATYAANFNEYVPPADTIAHPTRQAAVPEFANDPDRLPVRYGWAELLYEWLHPGTVISDLVEFAPGKWSFYPVQRNFRGQYKGVFTCPSSDFPQDHAGHYRVYAPFWSPMVVERDSRGRMEEAYFAWYGSRRITEFELEHILIGDSNEQDNTGDFTGGPHYETVDGCVYCYQCPTKGETSWIGIQGHRDISALVGEANTRQDSCGDRRGATRFAHRHRDKANYLFGDLHAEASGSVRDRLACDWDLDGVADPAKQATAERAQC